MSDARGGESIPVPVLTAGRIFLGAGARSIPFLCGGKIGTCTQVGREGKRAEQLATAVPVVEPSAIVYSTFEI